MGKTMSIDIEAIRERAALRIDCHRDPLDGERADEDRTALLEHVDTLALKIDVQRRLIAMLSLRRVKQTFDLSHLLAHQQARGIEAREEAERLAGDLDHAEHMLTLSQEDASVWDSQLRAENADLRTNVRFLGRLKAEYEEEIGLQKAQNAELLKALVKIREIPPSDDGWDKIDEAHLIAFRAMKREDDP